MRGFPGASTRPRYLTAGASSVNSLALVSFGSTRRETNMNLSDPITRRIVNPDSSDHYMELHRLDGMARVSVRGEIVAQSDDVLVVREVGARIYEPVLYFPRAGVAMAQLQANKHVTRCPLKGEASYFNGDTREHHDKDIAWSYQDLLDFDTELERLRDRIAFDQKNPRVEIEVLVPA
jgi:uncharacterized protein (DUF427 family)